MSNNYIEIAKAKDNILSISSNINPINGNIETKLLTKGGLLLSTSLNIASLADAKMTLEVGIDLAGQKLKTLPRIPTVTEVETLPSPDFADNKTIYAVGKNRDTEFYILWNKGPLLTPTNLSVSETTLKWNAVPDATSYNIKVDEIDFGNTTLTSYDLATNSNWINVTEGKHTAYVVAKDSEYYDSESSSITFIKESPKLKAPSISISNGKLNIVDTNKTNEVSSFDIYVDSVNTTFVNKKSTGATSFKLMNLGLDLLTYLIGVVAVPKSGVEKAQSDLTTISHTYTNPGYTITIYDYFYYEGSPVTFTFYYTNGTSVSYTDSLLYNNRHLGIVFHNVYKISGNGIDTSWYCDLVGDNNYYYFTPEGGKKYASMNIEENCVLYGDTPGNCITADSLVTMADGSTKQLGEIKTGDEILSYDWNTMQLIPNKVVYACSEDPDWNKWYCNRYFKWTFSDGTVIKNCFSHRFYNKEAKAFIYLEYWRLGDHTYKQDGTNPYLVSEEEVHERVHYARITGEKGTNYFANGLLTGDRHCPDNIVLPFNKEA